MTALVHEVGRRERDDHGFQAVCWDCGWASWVVSTPEYAGVIALDHREVHHPAAAVPASGTRSPSGFAEAGIGAVGCVGASGDAPAPTAPRSEP